MRKTLVGLFEQARKQSIHFFDLDETLFHHPTDEKGVRIHVAHPSGHRVASLTNTQFNNYKLPPGHKFDFSEFRSSHKFSQTAKPIRKTIAKLKALNSKGKKAEILTARADMDDKEDFGKHLNKYGIDIDKVHVRRAGNLPGSAAQNKKTIVSGLINKHGYNDVHLYDDNHENLNTFLGLKKDHPNVTFTAHHVEHDPVSGRVKITTTKV